jgi:pimeloyl-ACP methyl ester carboxylesterase
MKNIDLPVSQGTLRVHQFGNPKGQPMVILHGNHQSAALFFYLEQTQVAEYYNLFVPELPGHGQSQGFAPSDYGFDSMAKLLVQAFHQLLSNGSPVLVGHSLGGHFACQMIAHGFSPKALGLVSALPLRSIEDFGKAFIPSEVLGALFSPELTEDQMAVVARAFSQGIETYEQVFLESIRTVDPQFRAGMARLFAEPCFQNEVLTLEKSNIPVSLAIGDKDQFLHYPYYQEVVSLAAIHFAKNPLELVPQTFHFPFLSNPNWFVEFLLRCSG